MSFTDRMGVEIPEPPISVRNDAPIDFRLYLLQLMLQYEQLKHIRTYVCYVTKNAEDSGNWSENDFMKGEIQNLLEQCPWNRIYDIIEYFYEKLQQVNKEQFTKEINEYFIEKGIGWKLVNGIIEIRGEEAFEQKIKETVDILGQAELATSKNEIQEALKDMSKRPEPDITGAIQHSIAALECLCREITGDKKSTLGKLISDNPIIVPI